MCLFYVGQYTLPDSLAVGALGYYRAQNFDTVLVSSVDPTVGRYSYSLVTEVDERIDEAPMIEQIRVVRRGAVDKSLKIKQRQIFLGPSLRLNWKLRLISLYTCPRDIPLSCRDRQ